MKNTYQKGLTGKVRICGIILGAVMAAGCGKSTADLSEASCLTESAAWEGEKWDGSFEETDNSHTEVLPGFTMGSVPCFRDDAGKNTQIVDGYLYGYWNRRLCRYDLETLEETVLYEAVSRQHGDFCVWGDYVYFMEVPHVNSLDKFYGYLCRVRCDGSGEAVRLTRVVMPGQEWICNYYLNYKLDTYEDILYLIQQSGGNENLYFRLDQDGGITSVEESETLYGRLPEGEFKNWINFDGTIGSFMSLPYAMRNYGYVFMQNENGDRVRIDLDSQQVEVLEIPEEYIVRTVTNDAVIVSKYGSWYRIPLDNFQEVQTIREMRDDSTEYVAWDKNGIYLTEDIDEDGHGSLFFLDWEGEFSIIQLHNFLRKEYSPVTYLDGGYYYYVAEIQGNDVVRRMTLTGDHEIEEVAVYEENPFWELITRESFRFGWTDTYTGDRVDYSITKVFFKEDTGAYGRINDFLEDRYEQDMACLEEYKELVQEEHEGHGEEWGAEYVEYSDSYQVYYLDEEYVGIAGYREQYWKGGFHGSYGTVYYIFDRNTGHRAAVTDVVNNSLEEICEIMTPYVEAAAVWKTGEKGLKSVLLEEGRFFLSEEGIGVHFGVYEIGSYAEGEQDIIVPYEAFDRGSAD